MSVEKLLEQARDEVRRIVPPNIKITQIDFEGPIIIIYTEDMEGLANNIDIIRQLAQSLRRRVAIRPDPKLLSSAEEAEAEIRKIIPEEAEITDILNMRPARSPSKPLLPVWSSASMARSSMN
jgi:predicted metal-dependent RNase